MRPKNYLYRHERVMNGLYKIILTMSLKKSSHLIDQKFAIFTRDIDAIEKIYDMMKDANVYTHDEIQEEYHKIFYCKFENEII